MENKTIKNLLFITSGLLLFAYIIWRAYSLSFTHDESLTYSIISENSFWKCTTNNHFLNTHLIELCQNIFGKSEFSFRIPNVLAFVLYFMGFFYIMKPVKNLSIVVLGMAIVLLNPFLMDFFSLARGYGLSFAFMMLSMYFLLRDSFKEVSYRRYLFNFGFSMMWAALSLYSNFGAMNYYIACFGIFVAAYLFQYLKKTDISYRKPLYFIILVVIFILPVILGMNRLFILEARNELYHGTNNFHHTINSFIYGSFYWHQYPHWLFISIKYLLIFLIPAGTLLVVLKKDYFGKLSVSLLLLSMILLGFFLEFFLFHANYPWERTTLFFAPIIGIIAVFMALHVNQYYAPIAKINSLIVTVVSVCLIVHFLICANLTYTQTWKYDSHTKEVMKYVKDNIPRDGNKRTISNEWLFEPTINFYINIWDLPLHKTDRSGVNLNTDYIYRVNNFDEWEGYRVVKSFVNTRSELLETVK